MKAAIYCRVSTDKQENEGTSLVSQKAECLAKARELNYEVGEDYIISESFTGASLERPELDKVRKWVRDEEVKAVICFDADRLARDFVILMVLANEFEKAGAKLIFVTQQVGSTPEDRMLFGMKGLFAEYERAKILDRTQRGKLARAQEGKLCGGLSSQLYGYDYSKGKRSINDEQTQIVRSIFSWFTEERLAIGSVVSRLVSIRIPSPSGKANWSKAQVGKMLKNKAYTGETHILFKSSGQQLELPNATPQIISKEVFNQAQVQLRRNKELARRNLKHEYMLRGFVFCQRCGRRYTGAVRRTTKSNRVVVSHNYRCGRQFDTSSPTRCHNRIWNARILEGIVWEQVETVLSTPETVLMGIKAIETEANPKNSIEQELIKVISRLKELDTEQDKLLQWALKGFPEDTIVKENKKINNHRNELKQWKVQIEHQLEVSKQNTVNIESIKKACELVSKNLTELSFESKRLALEALNIKVLIDGQDIRIGGVIPIYDGVIVTTPLPPHLSLAHPLCL